MPSKRELVVQAIVGLVVAVLPNAKVLRNEDRPRRAEAGGIVIVRDGDPGEADVDLSPLTYNYQHPIELELCAPLGSTLTAVDTMLLAIGAAVRADRSLGGLCDFLETGAASADEAHGRGTEGLPWASASVIAHYATPDPL